MYIGTNSLKARIENERFILKRSNCHQSLKFYVVVLQSTTVIQCLTHVLHDCFFLFLSSRVLSSHEHSFFRACRTCFSLFAHASVHLSVYCRFMVTLLFQDVRRDILHYHKPSSSSSVVDPFEKFTNLPADRQLLLRNRDCLEDCRQMYETISSV